MARLLVAIALVSIVADATVGMSLGRRLTLEHASQNVIATPPDKPAHAVRLVITANYDAGRAALAYRNVFRAASARLRQLLGDRAPGWIAWITVATAWLLGTAILRMAGVSKSTVGARAGHPDHRPGHRAAACCSISPAPTGALAPTTTQAA